MAFIESNSVIASVDNDSPDNTSPVAAGVVVRSEPHRRQGDVVRRVFPDIEANIYVTVNGDATSEAARAPRLTRTLLEQRLDMVVGQRVTDLEEACRPGQRCGNRHFAGCIAGSR